MKGRNNVISWEMGGRDKSGLCWEDIFSTATAFQTSNLKDRTGSCCNGLHSFACLPAAMAPGEDIV